MRLHNTVGFAQRGHGAPWLAPTKGHEFSTEAMQTRFSRWGWRSLAQSSSANPMPSIVTQVNLL